MLTWYYGTFSLKLVCRNDFRKDTMLKQVTMWNADGCYIAEISSQHFNVGAIIQRGLYQASFSPVNYPVQQQ